MPSSVEALLDTLVAQGVERTIDPRETVGQAEGFDEAMAALGPLPRGRIGPEEDRDLVVQTEIGRGGMGVVYLAHQRGLDRDVALKRCRRDEADAVQVLVQEARIMGSLEHPGIIPVHALVADEQGPAVVMKRVAGVSWSEAFRNISLERNLEIFIQLCNAVAYAHSRGIVHRDIKPANVLLGEYGEVYLSDWGLARPTATERTGRISGSPAYMAPEMFSGEADERTDVYLLGATLHQILTGQPRHRGSLAEVLQSVARPEPFEYPDSVPADLAAICNRACAMDPMERFERVSELRQAVRAHGRLRTARELLITAEGRARALADAATHDPTAVDELFTEARFGFGQAVQSLAEVGGRAMKELAAVEIERARSGREGLLASMVRIELDRRQPEAALALLTAMRNPPPELRDEALAERDAVSSERDRLSRLEADRDPRVGARARSWAELTLAASVLVLTLLFAVLAPRHESTPARLAIVGLVVFSLIAVVAVIWRRRSEWNLMNRRIAQVALVAAGGSALQRVVALRTDAEPLHILLTDAFILGMAGLALIPFHRAGAVLTLFALGAIGVGMLEGRFIDEVFVGFAVGVPVALLIRQFLRRMRGRPR